MTWNAVPCWATSRRRRNAAVWGFCYRVGVAEERPK